MTPKLKTTPIKQTYCSSCNLSTRADSRRCLHCGHPLPEPEAEPASKAANLSK